MQHTEEEREQHTENREQNNTEQHTEQHTEDNAQPQRTDTTQSCTYNFDFYHEYAYIKNSYTKVVRGSKR